MSQPNHKWWLYRVPFDDMAMAVIGAINMALAFIPPGTLNAAFGGWCLGIAFQSITSGVFEQERRAYLNELRRMVEP